MGKDSDFQVLKDKVSLIAKVVPIHFVTRDHTEAFVRQDAGKKRVLHRFEDFGVMYFNLLKKDQASNVISSPFIKSKGQYARLTASTVPKLWPGRQRRKSSRRIRITFGMYNMFFWSDASGVLCK